ncbi:MAG: nuclear transport factor 2 family protein [Candidatus Zixiibacteriota bacterium]
MGQNGDIVRSLYAAFARGDVAAVLGAFDANIQWREAESVRYADRNPYRDPMAVAEGVFMRIMADVDNFTVTPEQFLEGGDGVLAEGRYRGKVKATGKPIDAQFAHVWRLRDGKIVGFQQYTDTRQWAEALGG